MSVHQRDMITRYSRPRKRLASGMKLRADKSPDMDRVISQPGGFADDEDGDSVAADRGDIATPAKPNRRSATVCLPAVLPAFQACG